MTGSAGGKGGPTCIRAVSTHLQTVALPSRTTRALNTATSVLLVDPGLRVGLEKRSYRGPYVPFTAVLSPMT